MGFFMIEMKSSVVSYATCGNLFFNSHASTLALFSALVEVVSDARYLTALATPYLTATRTPAPRSAERSKQVKSWKFEDE